MLTWRHNDTAPAQPLAIFPLGCSTLTSPHISPSLLLCVPSGWTHGNHELPLRPELTQNPTCVSKTWVKKAKLSFS